MSIRVLIVDDSSFFRRRIAEIVSKDPTMEVAGSANNGRDAVKMALELKPDVITMDVEMPILNGIEAVKQIMAQQPTPIIMFSSLTLEGATLTFNALDAGALDFITKNFDEIARDREQAMDIIRNKIKDIARQRYQLYKKSPSSSSQTSTSRLGSSTASASSRFGTTRSTIGTTSSTTRSTIATNSSSTSSLSRFGTTRSTVASSTTQRNTTSTTLGSRLSSPLATASSSVQSSSVSSSSAQEISSSVGYKTSGKKYNLLAIGSSTGGPIALQSVLTSLPRSFPVPIVVVQHMPATFTTTFAARLDKLCQVTVTEAKDGETLQAGHVYIAPGGMQMTVEGKGAQAKLKIQESAPAMCYKPCVDNTFSSINDAFGGSVLAVILTGMGNDGKEGCAKLKQSGATIWAQNEATCVIYGMPQAVVNAGIAKNVIPLPEIGKCITKEVMNL